MQLEYISASRLDTYLQCPLKYHAQYDLGMRDEPGEPARLGLAVHESMESATNAIIAGKTGLEIDPYYYLPAALLKNGVLEFEEDAKSMIQNAIDWGYFQNVSVCKGCEVEFKEPLPDGTNIYGFIDRLDVRGNFADVKDLKTGKRAFPDVNLKDKWQGRIYNIAARALHPVVEIVSVSYWVLRHRVQKAVYSADDAERDSNELVELGMEILACENPQPNPGPLCPWCPNLNCVARQSGPKKKYDNRRRK